MVKILKLFSYSAFFILALIYFSPKESLYYFGEKEAQKHKIILSDENIKDSGFSLGLSNANLTYDSIHSANIENINIKPFLLYNSISAKNIKLSSMLSSFIPSYIENIDISYTVFNPLIITLNANGEFGKAAGEINILDRNISIDVIPSAVMKEKHRDTLGNLKKSMHGGYRYDNSF